MKNEYDMFPHSSNASKGNKLQVQQPQEETVVTHKKKRRRRKKGNKTPNANQSASDNAAIEVIPSTSSANASTESGAAEKQD
jgi:hypothetical protein